MSPTDAKQKWCPFARVGYTQYIPTLTRWASSGQSYVEEQPAQVVSINRMNPYDKTTTPCLATDCMMWRQHALDSDDGHCGLAGFANHGE